LAKQLGIATWLVGHVTKSGDLAGPKVLEHFVDTVLYFEGDGSSTLRVLRAVKNRFGASGELGVFEMTDKGLVEVPDASARLLKERAPDAAGTAVIATLQGSRPLLTEIQALVSERNRLLMLLAVLSKCGINIAERDVFANVAGGVRLEEPGADLGLIAALVSSFENRAIDAHTLLVGEVGLVGEVRSVPQPVLRLKEAERHGFRRIIVPASTPPSTLPGLEVIRVGSITQAIAAMWAT